jgi:hypothetical protein
MASRYSGCWNGGWRADSAILTDVLRASYGSDKLGDTLDAILHTITSRLSVCLGSIYVIERVGTDLKLVLRAALGVQSVDRDRAEYRVGEGLTGHIATGQTLIFRSLSERRNQPHYSGKYDHELEVPSNCIRCPAFIGMPSPSMERS